MRLLTIAAVLVATGVAVLAACGDGDEPAASTHDSTLVLAVGDGADGRAPSRALARYIVSRRPDRFFYLGDVYETGTAREFRRRYHPMYGGLSGRTDPVIGNHEYANRARGYYPYWKRERGWSKGRAKHRAYRDRVSGWQVIAYSSETGMKREGEWVARQLARYDGTCRIVMAHRGRHMVADARHGDNKSQQPVWRYLRGSTAINLVGHNHLYGRLEPIDGVTVIVSGAGGHHLRPLGPQHHRVAASKTHVATVTELVLREGEARIRQLAADGEVHDELTVRCTPLEG